MKINKLFRPKTVGALDMGGASMQIAMEVTSDLSLQGFSDKDKSQVVEVNLGCRDHDTSHRYRLFVTTFLGYGANEAIARYHRHLLLSQLEEKSLADIKGYDPLDPISDPCLPQGLNENVTLHIEPDHFKTEELRKLFGQEQTIHLSGIGQWDKCYQILTEFTKERELYFKPCSSDDQGCPSSGIQMPPMPMQSSEFYGFSEFWYTMEDVLGMGGPYDYDKYAQASSTFCSRPWSSIYKEYVNGEFPSADLERLKTQCIKSTWVAVSLHEGFKFPKKMAQMASAPNTVNGQVVHWTVGALIYRTRFYPLR